MGVTVKTADFAANTSTGTQDLTITGAGASGDMVACLIVASYAVTDGTPAANAVWSWGVTDGTREAVCAAGVEDNVGTQNSQRALDDASMILLMDPSSATPMNAYDGVAVFDSWVTDGIRIDWTTAPSAAYRLHVVLMNSASDLQAYVYGGNADGTEDVQLNFDDAGFQPDMVLFALTARPADKTFGNDAYIHNVGGAYDTGAGIGQSAIKFHVDHARTNSRSAIYNFNDRCAIRAGGGAPSEWWEFTEFRANGFGVTMRNGTTNDQFVYLALKSDTNGMYVGHRQGAASGTGSKSFTGFGFKPQFVCINHQLMTTLNSQDGSGINCGSISAGFFDDTREHSVWWQSDDGVSTMDCNNEWNSNALYCPQEDGTTVDVDAAFTSLDADGYTLNYTSNSIPLAYEFVWGIEEDAAAVPGEPGHKAANRTRRAMNQLLVR